MSARKVLVSLEAWKLLEAALNALPREPNLFTTGGPLVDVELHTDRDWALQHAAYLLRRSVKP